MTIRKILIAHDLSDAAARALRYAAHLAHQIGATIDVAYVHPDLPTSAREKSPPGLPPAPAGQPERFTRFLHEELSRLVGEAVGDAASAVRCHVVRGDPVHELKVLAQDLNADVLCLGATGKGAVARMLLGSVALLVLRSARVSVLIVP